MRIKKNLLYKEDFIVVNEKTWNLLKKHFKAGLFKFKNIIKRLGPEIKYKVENYLYSNNSYIITS